MQVPDFTLPEGGYQYRPLRLLKPELSGWDVYALQRALTDLDVSTEADGYFGEGCDEAVKTFQTRTGLVVDGIAGILSQRRACVLMAQDIQQKFNLPKALLRGQAEQECGFQLGNHTPVYATGPSAGSRDRGVVQMNSAVWPDTEAAFNAPYALRALARQLQKKHKEYEGLMGPGEYRRTWELAAGSWNAPAWTDRLARGEELTATQSAHIEGYIDAVTAYVRW